MGIVNIKKVTALLNMVVATEENIDFLEGDLLGLGDEEPDEGGKTEIHGKEEVEGVAENWLVVSKRPLFAFDDVDDVQIGWLGELTSRSLRGMLGRIAGRLSSQRFAFGSTCLELARGRSWRKLRPSTANDQVSIL